MVYGYCIKLRTYYIQAAARRESMLTEVLDREVVVLDSLNLAGFEKNKSGFWNWDHVVSAAEHYGKKGHPVICVCPVWIPKEVKIKLKEICMMVDLFGHDKSIDDKYVLMHTLLYDGFFVSNDTNMSEHFVKSNVFIRNWVERSRIGFKFEEGTFVPYQQRPDQTKEPASHSLFGEEVRE
tara:strand:+ start:1442 stop:1981 length:540 start_codon:yes stop_codon:yes gene_type:complete